MGGGLKAILKKITQKQIFSEDYLPKGERIYDCHFGPLIDNVLLTIKSSMFIHIKIQKNIRIPLSCDNIRKKSY